MRELSVRPLISWAKGLDKVRETNTSIVDIANGVDVLQEDITDDPPRFQERASANICIVGGEGYKPLPPPARPAIQSVEPSETGPRLKVEGETVKFREPNVKVGASKLIMLHGTSHEQDMSGPPAPDNERTYHSKPHLQS